MSSSTPTFIFIPGGFSPSFYYHNVVSQLTSQGYSALALDLPSIGIKEDREPATFYDDAAYIRSEAAKILDSGTDVIILGNSYGGYVTLEAVKGLSKQAREAAGKKNAVVHVIIMGSLLPSVGKTVAEIVGNNIPVDLSTPNPKPYIDPFPALEMGKFLFGSLSEEEQIFYGEKGLAMSARTFTEPLTYAAWEEIPTTALIGRKDAALSPQLQEQSVDEVNAKGRGLKVGKKFIDADHCAMVSHPEEVVRACLEVAKGE